MSAQSPVNLKTIPKEKLVEYKAAFDSFDADRNGLIDCSELRVLLKKLHIPLTEVAIRNSIRAIDLDNNGYIDFPEFVTFMESGSDIPKEREIVSMFKLADKDGNGFLDRNELHQVMNDLGYRNITSEDVNDMMAVLDANGDNLVSLKEFHDFMLTVL